MSYHDTARVGAGVPLHHEPEPAPLDRLHIEAWRIVASGVEEARRMMLSLPTTDQDARRLREHMEIDLGQDCDLQQAREAVETVQRYVDGPYYGRDFNGERYSETVTLRLAFTVTVDVAEYLLTHERPAHEPHEPGPGYDLRRHVLDDLRTQATDEARAAVAELGYVTEAKHANCHVKLIWE